MTMNTAKRTKLSTAYSRDGFFLPYDVIDESEANALQILRCYTLGQIDFYPDSMH